jgi:hypothetical protein
MRRQTIGLLIGGFVVYEVIAWKVNGKRIAQSLATDGVTPSLLPFDFIGGKFGYPAPPVQAPLTASNYPGVVPNTPLDPNNLLPLPSLGF